MYHVLIAEDEPASMQHINTLIQIKCPDFEVVGTAENGKEAFEKISRLRPDVLITDVKMPVMDGVTLVNKVKERYPEVLSIIVSGYPEFSYAQEALRAGASDYLLKPLKPSAFQEGINIIRGKLDELYYRLRNSMIHDMCMGIQPDKVRFDRAFAEDEYYIAIIRKNCLPRRFLNSRKMEIFSGKEEKIMIYGRDEMESLYICPRKVLFHYSFYQLMQHEIEKEKEKDGFSFYTLVLHEDSIVSTQLPDVIRRLYRTLDYCLVIGKDQTVILDKDISVKSSENTRELDKLEILVKEHSVSKIVCEIQNCFEKWKKEERTQLWTEDKVHEIFYLFRKYNMLDESVKTYEYYLDEIFYSVSDMNDIAESIIQLLKKNSSEEKNRQKLDTPEFFNKVLEYIERHLAEPLSPESVAKVFGISQTYLNRLFRKYSKTDLTEP